MKKKFVLGLITLFMAFGLTSCAQDGRTPYIGDNGNWWIGDSDLGIPATGPSGSDGKDGSSVTVVSVQKTGTDGLVDTYTITFSDGTTTTFTVTNGESSVIESIELTSTSGLVDTYTITFTNGAKQTFTVTNGKDGQNLTVVSIELKSSEGLIDTYVITYSDGTKFEFVVSNGADGLTPYIGDNGHWWIGDTDTGVIADWEKANNIPLTIASNGLQYKTMTVDGRSGFVVTGWSVDDIDDDYLYTKYGKDYDVILDEMEEGNIPLVIPNYIGSIPVIGVASNVDINFKKIILSSNTIFIGKAAFANCENLQEIDFNGANLICIPPSCFYNTSLTNVTLPDTVTHIYDYAFQNVCLTSINLQNIKYFGKSAFDDTFFDYVYLSKNVEFVGDHAFDSTFVYVEVDEKPSTWTYSSSSALAMIYGVKNNGEYLYSTNNNEVTIYQYLGNQKKLEVPETIENMPITTIGAGFNSYIYDEDRIGYGKTEAETYHIMRNMDGYITELVIGNNVNKIDKYSLLNGNMFIYIGDNVEEIYYSGTNASIGRFYNTSINDGFPYSLIVLEDSTNIKFNDNGTIRTYDECVALDDDYEIFFKANIRYEDIFESNNVYYHLVNSSYELFAFMDSYLDYVVIPDIVNNLPVTSIGRYAFIITKFNKLFVGNNIQRIRTCALCGASGKVFVPSTVSIINSNAFALSKGSIIYTDASAKKEDWDSNWNPYSLTVNYSFSKSEFDNL